jgi:phosphoribosylformimino-5-aminoimidazole carboxamide ribotide isomerase
MRNSEPKKKSVSILTDLRLVEHAGRGNVDVTVGSALDLFGGKGLIYKDLVTWNQRHE